MAERDKTLVAVVLGSIAAVIGFWFIGGALGWTVGGAGAGAALFGVTNLLKGGGRPGT